MSVHGNVISYARTSDSEVIVDERERAVYYVYARQHYVEIYPNRTNITRADDGVRALSHHTREHVDLKLVKCVVGASACRIIFRNAHNLESLEIRDLFDPDEPGNSSLQGVQEEGPLLDALDGEICHLKSLRKVVLSGIPMGLAMCFLIGCQCPVLRALSLGPIMHLRATNVHLIWFRETLSSFVRQASTSVGLQNA